MAGDRTGAFAHRFPRRAWVKGAAGLVALLVVAACENGGLGIFHTLATESERANRNLDDNLTVGGVVRAAGRYYVAAGGMWSRPTGEGNWEAVERPGSKDKPMLVLGLAAIDDTLCAATKEGIYHAQAHPGSPSAWTRAGVTDQVLRVFEVRGSEGKVLAVTRTHDVYRSPDCASFTKVELPSGASGRPFDALLHDDTYWLTAGNQVYSGPSLDELEAAGAPAEGEYRGIWCATDPDRCYFANRNGRIYRSDGSDWHVAAEIESPNDDIPTVLLTLFVEVGDKVLIGTQGFGFYQFDATDVELGKIVRGPRSTSQLYQAHVTLFARFEDIVFAGTAGKGLSSIAVKKAREDTGTWDWE